MAPINSNFFYYERPCLVCGQGMLIAEGDLHKPRVPCSRCVKGGNTTYNDAPSIRLTYEEPEEPTDEG